MRASTDRTQKLERKVVDTALADYRRLRDLGWTEEDLGGMAREHFIACKRLDVFLAKRKK